MSATSKPSEAQEDSIDLDEFKCKLNIDTATDTSANGASVPEPGNRDVKVEEIKQEDDPDHLDATGGTKLQPNVKEELEERIKELEIIVDQRNKEIVTLQNERDEATHSANAYSLELEACRKHMKDAIEHLLDEITLSNEKIADAHDVAVTLPPKLSQNESFVLCKLGGYKKRNGNRIELEDDLYYAIRRREETVARAIRHLEAVYPEVRQVDKWEKVPNSKHLHSALKNHLPPDSMRGNIITLLDGMSEEELINLIERTNNEKPF